MLLISNLSNNTSSNPSEKIFVAPGHVFHRNNNLLALDSNQENIYFGAQSPFSSSGKSGEYMNTPLQVKVFSSVPSSSPVPLWADAAHQNFGYKSEKKHQKVKVIHVLQHSISSSILDGVEEVWCVWKHHYTQLLSTTDHTTTNCGAAVMDRKLINGLCFRCWSCKAWSWLSDSLCTVGHSLFLISLPCPSISLQFSMGSIYWISVLRNLLQPTWADQGGGTRWSQEVPDNPTDFVLLVWWRGSRNWTCFKMLSNNRTVNFIPTGFITQQQTRKKRREGCREEEKRDCLSQDLCFKKHSSIRALWSLLNLNWWGR